ncbi:MAG: 2OG-Fe dioxygenase family protein [Burkholderiaceae bacterium]|nr:2OG-Fe dioxygenase family protein [Burkholderiaceae bacterium]
MSAALLPPPISAAGAVDAALREHGHAVLDAAGLYASLAAAPAALDAWPGYWNRLPPDTHLRDGGRYRQRRHGAFVVEGASVSAAPQRAHWQPVEYNALHGGFERWFEPLEPALLAEPLWPRLLLWLAARASALRGAQPWFVEAHPFRIDTTGGIGRPTPEGAHRDGVDLVAVLLVAREGVKGGETRVFDAAGPAGLRFTMSQPWTTLLLDDARVIHETTPIQPLDAAQRGYRDTLVVTLRTGGFQGPGTG